MANHSINNQIYTQSLEQINEFRFDERMARALPDRIRRPVSGYGTLLNMIRVRASAYLGTASSAQTSGSSTSTSSPWRPALDRL